ncbi:BlaI/MecI/CopY family transcriptional regulator [Larkinella punicea]|uniref:BlaI/MecI/CopY family transcriptional regulator n=1 Tax=Larkinella punicea TaxID=2315727 RepID=A0A368JS52_9BACT|nr:BlaI/MecI/CopY family transcriptional regulator [Larkinella punicea]RCR70165.1 BlaI/MecI/CopY family transcriptional regulator [Larkinella punicea]
MNKLSVQEEEAMLVIWKSQGGFVKDFLDQLPEPRPPYTTLASTIRNLERKGFLESKKWGNTYRYEPLISEEEYKKRFMSGFVSDYFRNSFKELVAFFAEDQKISADELKEIIEMIEKRKSD